MPIATQQVTTKPSHTTHLVTTSLSDSIQSQSSITESPTSTSAAPALTALPTAIAPDTTTTTTRPTTPATTTITKDPALYFSFRAGKTIPTMKK